MNPERPRCVFCDRPFNNQNDLSVHESKCAKAPIAASRFYYLNAAAPYAYLVIDNLSGQQIGGSVIRSSEGCYTYSRAFWDGKKQSWDTFSASSLPELSVLIDQYLEPKV